MIGLIRLQSIFVRDSSGTFLEVRIAGHDDERANFERRVEFSRTEKPFNSNPTMAQENDLCSVCFVGHLTLHPTDGTMLWCEACGDTQPFLQALEVVEAFDTAVYGVRSQRTQSQRAPLQLTERVRKITLGEVEASVRDWVVLLRMCLEDGVDRMIHELLLGGIGQRRRRRRRGEARENGENCDAVENAENGGGAGSETDNISLDGVRRAVDSIYWRWVEDSGVLEEDGGAKVVEETNRSTVEQTDLRRVAIERFLGEHLRFEVIYAILLIGCIHERWPVDPYDVTALFVSTGALRMDMVPGGREPVRRSLASFDYMCGDGVPSPVRLYLDARELVEQLGIALPPINVHGWLARFECSESQTNANDTNSGPHVMAGLYCSDLRLDSLPALHVKNSVMPWSVLASATGFGVEKPRTEDLLLPRNEHFVTQQIGEARLRAYTSWFVDMINGMRRSGVDQSSRKGRSNGIDRTDLSELTHAVEGEDGSFESILDKVARKVEELELERGRSVPTSPPLSAVPSTEPWCYVRGQKLHLDNVMRDNEQEVRRVLEGGGSSEAASVMEWLEFVAGYQAKQDEVKRRIAELLRGSSRPVEGAGYNKTMTRR